MKFSFSKHEPESHQVLNFHFMRNTGEGASRLSDTTKNNEKDAERRITAWQLVCLHPKTISREMYQYSPKMGKLQMSLN